MIIKALSSATIMKEFLDWQAQLNRSLIIDEDEMDRLARRNPFNGYPHEKLISIGKAHYLCKKSTAVIWEVVDYGSSKAHYFKKIWKGPEELKEDMSNSNTNTREISHKNIANNNAILLCDEPLFQTPSLSCNDLSNEEIDEFNIQIEQELLKKLKSEERQQNITKIALNSPTFSWPNNIRQPIYHSLVKKILLQDAEKERITNERHMNSKKQQEYDSRYGLTLFQKLPNKTSLPEHTSIRNEGYVLINKKEAEDTNNGRSQCLTM